MRRAVLVAVTGVALVAAAIAVVNAWGATPPSNANGSVAVTSLRSIAGEYVSVNDSGAPAIVIAGVPVRLTVDSGRVLAHAGCNSMQGDARVVDGRLVVPALAVTEIACPTDVAAQEQWVMTMLTSRPRLERSGPYLSLLWDGHWLGLSSDPADLQAVSPSA